MCASKKFLLISAIAFSPAVLGAVALDTWGLKIALPAPAAGIIAGYLIWLAARHFGPRWYIILPSVLLSAATWVMGLGLGIGWANCSSTTDGTSMGLLMLYILLLPFAIVIGAAFGALLSSRWMQDAA